MCSSRDRYILICRSKHRTLDSRLWTLDSGLWTLDSGLWTLDSGLWTLDSGLLTLDSGLWTLDMLLLLYGTTTCVHELQSSTLLILQVSLLCRNPNKHLHESVLTSRQLATAAYLHHSELIMALNSSKVIIVCGTALGLSLIFLIRWRQKRELRRRQRRKNQGTLNIGGNTSCCTVCCHYFASHWTLLITMTSIYLKSFPRYLRLRFWRHFIKDCLF